MTRINKALSKGTHKGLRRSQLAPRRPLRVSREVKSLPDVDQRRSKVSGVVRSAPDADRKPDGAGTKPDKDANANGSGSKGETQSIHPSEPSPARDESSLSTASSPGDKVPLSTTMWKKSKYSESAPPSQPATSIRDRVPLLSSQLIRMMRNVLAKSRSPVVSKGPLTGRKCLITGGTSGIGKNVSLQTSSPSVFGLRSSQWTGYAIA